MEKLLHAKTNPSINNSVSDEVIWQEFKSGDEKAYAFIYQQHFFSLYQYGYKICANREIVKDAIHDLFVDIWNNKQNLSNTTSIKFYLWSSLKRKLLKNLKKEELINRFEDSYSIASFENQELKLINQDDYNEKKEKIYKALNRLSKQQKKAVELKFFQNKGNDEIARQMSISTASVYNLISKSLKVLRKHLVIILLFTCLALTKFLFTSTFL